MQEEREEVTNISNWIQLFSFIVGCYGWWDYRGPLYFTRLEGIARVILVFAFVALISIRASMVTAIGARFIRLTFSLAPTASFRRIWKHENPK